MLLYADKSTLDYASLGHSHRNQADRRQLQLGRVSSTLAIWHGISEDTRSAPVQMILETHSRLVESRRRTCSAASRGQVGVVQHSLLGIVLSCHAAAFNYSRLLVARIFLGFFEASHAGLHVITSM